MPPYSVPRVQRGTKKLQTNRMLQIPKIKSLINRVRIPRFLKYIIGAIAVIVAWQFVIQPVLRNITGFDEVMWRGEKFKLKRKYLDYEEYKSDHDQLAPSEIARVRQFMLAISVPKTAGSDTDLIHSLGEMRFPGFGSSYAGAVRDEQGNRYILNEYEIPQTQEQRTLLYRVEKDGTCRLVLDGVSVDHENDHKLWLGKGEVKVEDGKLKHFLDGKMYREIPLGEIN